MLRTNPVDEPTVQAIVDLPLEQFCQLAPPILMRAKLASGINIDVIQDGHHRYEACLRRNIMPSVWLFTVEDYLNIVFKYFEGMTQATNLHALHYIQCGDKTALELGDNLPFDQLPDFKPRYQDDTPQQDQ